MCGIAGIISPGGMELAHLQAMSRALVHRGPDGHGFMAYGPQQGMRLALNRPMDPREAKGALVGLAHRRLAIIDLSGENSQPLADPGKTACVCYNGEIYNYPEIRQELEAAGEKFFTTGDTEVLLRAFQVWGLDCLSRLNGMWAFALLDTRQNRVVLSRDRFGIKPLFYTLANGSLYFASEIKALLAVDGAARQPDEETLSRFLYSGHTDDGERTFFSGIKRLPAGHFAVVNLGEEISRVDCRPYWELSEKPFEGDFSRATEQFLELFSDSVSLRYRSDVEVGTCLSGGLDSSAVVCVSDQLKKEGKIGPSGGHLVFGYCSPEKEWNEQKYMEMVAKKTKVRLIPVVFSPDDFLQNSGSILHAQDEPFGSASIAAQWFVFRRVKEAGIKVMLDGQGADEIMAGYHPYFRSFAKDLIAAGRYGAFLYFYKTFLRQYGHRPLSPLEMANSIGVPGFPSLLSAAGKAAGVARSFKPGAQSPGPMDQALTPRVTARAVRFLENRQDLPGRSGLDRQLRTNTLVNGLPALLRYEDRNSMAHSIEARVPFLDYRLVEFLFGLPDDFKIREAETKAVMRSAVKHMVPEPIVRRKDKIGFKADTGLTAHLAGNYDGDLNENQGQWETRWFAKDAVKNLLHRPEQEFFLWRVINTKLWARSHFD